MSDGMRLLLTQKELDGELLTSIANVMHNVLDQGLNVLCDVFIGGSARDDEFERLNEEQDCFREDEDGYETMKKGLRNSIRHIASHESNETYPGGFAKEA